jgi:hypothetical protein
VISLSPIIALLKPAPLGFERDWLREVGGAAEFSRIAKGNTLPLPAAWVVRAADSVTPAGERAEDVTLAFDVVIAITNERMASAGTTDDELLRYRHAVHKLLLGYELPDANGCNAPVLRPIQFAGGAVIEYTEGDLWWADRYRFNAHLTNYLPDPAPFAGLVHNPSATF